MSLELRRGGAAPTVCLRSYTHRTTSARRVERDLMRAPTRRTQTGYTFDKHSSRSPRSWHALACAPSQRTRRRVRGKRRARTGSTHRAATRAPGRESGGLGVSGPERGTLLAAAQRPGRVKTEPFRSKREGVSLFPERQNRTVPYCATNGLHIHYAFGNAPRGFARRTFAD